MYMLYYFSGEQYNHMSVHVSKVVMVLNIAMACVSTMIYIDVSKSWEHIQMAIIWAVLLLYDKSSVYCLFMYIPSYQIKHKILCKIHMTCNYLWACQHWICRWSSNSRHHYIYNYQRHWCLQGSHRGYRWVLIMFYVDISLLLLDLFITLDIMKQYYGSMGWCKKYITPVH